MGFLEMPLHWQYAILPAQGYAPGWHLAHCIVAGDWGWYERIGKWTRRRRAWRRVTHDFPRHQRIPWRRVKRAWQRLET